MSASSKILINDDPPRWLDLNAPTVMAHVVSLGGQELWRITCPFCAASHLHGPGEGHRFAHCVNQSDDAGRGYNLAVARREWNELLDEIAITPEEDRGPLLDEMDRHEYDAGQESLED